MVNNGVLIVGAAGITSSRNESMAHKSYQGIHRAWYISFYSILVLNIKWTFANILIWKTQLVLLRMHRNFKFLRDDGMTRTTKIVNRRWHLPPMQRTLPIQPSCSIVFVVGVFIITYWTLLQKESSNWLLLVMELVGDQPIEHGLVTNWQRNAIRAFCRDPIFVMKRAK
jgi:hypothetical protein